jgi:UDP-N-acetylglucosamine--N-acetylmuramyl-(pentapeptide) pyrophosphoryl-undecaprenol N-acetylglucosamine transferase
LGYPITGPWKLNGKTVVTGTPVRTMTLSVTQFTYPEGYDPNATTIVICGGSQGAASMNESLIGPVKKMADNGLQIVWQTGTPSFDKITCQMSGYQRLFIFAVIHDLYPYYEHAKVLICRAGASTLSEAAYFGLPCIMIPLPWAADNHQWKNAGIVEQQGWGIRVDQNEQCGTKVEQAVFQIVTNTLQYTKMRQKALLNSPAHSAAKIVEIVISQLKKA